ncbi:microtubule-associated tumor suppressor candidate 2 isoform X2 [Anarrhichthys ocellatus]|uniref:microtubule-associated tumor suppressor candidate 2 isoform X2 n=1 Tax=Anarrhichthys ocellatus TaxID=433405 RepID=UPI0012EE1CFF|nr:microtubule-associated tumor suppressor candidate 2-like isoform X2 [Anarrhichthys ocellatus]
MSERGETFGDGEVRNNNQQGGVLADGDANANEIQTEDGGMAGDTGTLSGLMTETAQQDKFIIWGTDSQCDDPDLAEFEMLECRELEAYLVEDGEDIVGLVDRKQRSSCSKATVEQVTDIKSREERKSVQHCASEQESSASHVSESREASRTEFSSETDVFVTCLSSISSMDTAMDTAGRTQTTDSWNMASGPYSTISEDLTLVSLNGNTITESGKASQKADHPSLSSGKSTIHRADVDMNLNSTVHSEDVVLQAQVGNGVDLCEGVIDEHRTNKNQINKAGNTISEGECYRWRSTEHKGSHAAKTSHEESPKNDKSTQADEAPVVNYSLPKTGTKGTQSSIESKATKNKGSFDNSLKKQNSFDKSFKKQPLFDNTLKKQLSFDNTLKKQGSFEKTVTSSTSSLERRKPWGSPSRTATPNSPKTTSCSPKRRPPGSPAKVQSIRALSLERSDSPQRGLSQTVRPPSKTSLNSCIPKPVTSQQKEPEPRRTSPPQKPKNVRPKIITYVRKNPQAKPQGTDAPLEASALPLRLSSYSSQPTQKDPQVGPQPKSTPVLCSSNLLFDKYRQEMQKVGYYPPGMAATGMKPPSSTIPQRLSGKSGSFHEEMSEKYLQEHVSQEGGSVYRSPRALRPQLGLGAVTRQPAAKTRVQQTGQRSAPVPGQSAQAVGASTHGYPDPAGEQKRSGERGPETGPKSVLHKSGQSGLRPPCFSGLPAARMATFGFARTSSVSSVSSNQSSESCHSDPCRPSQHPGNGSDDTPLHNATAPPSEASHAQSRPPNAPSLQRRSLPPQRCSPLASRREIQRDIGAAVPPMSSPKRFAVVSPKPQSPVRGQTAAADRAVQTERAQELDRVLIQQLRERCEQQDLQLQSLQAQLKKASLCLDVFSITTQHFCQKSESAIVKERELSLELARIRDEVAFSVAHWEQLQQEKEELERRFEAKLQGLRAQQQRELGVLEERLKAQHVAKAKSLQAQQRAELEELRVKQQEQIEAMSENHEASLMEMETTHDDTLATLQEEHARTVKNLKMAHEQQTKSLGEEFEKIRLTLQDQVDTMTFQNRSLRDRAKRFEEALRKSTDEQILDALAPYKHIDEDLKSLKEVLEMKNQQIHQQDLKISELEKIAEKNVYLEERVQVLQQQNEDLKERIDKNVAVSRQLSEDNANLHVNVEKESKEKKRLSRNNEELLWRLQTGELSPRMSPSSSPLHRPPSGPGSPARPHSYHQ